MVITSINLALSTETPVALQNDLNSNKLCKCLKHNPTFNTENKAFKEDKYKDNRQIIKNCLHLNRNMA